MLLLPPPPSAAPARPPRNVVIPLFKDLPKLLLVFGLVMGAAGAAAVMLQPHYHAEALLYVKFGREYAWRSETGEAETMPQNFEAKQVLKAEARMLNVTALAASCHAWARRGAASCHRRRSCRPRPWRPSASSSTCTPRPGRTATSSR